MSTVNLDNISIVAGSADNLPSACAKINSNFTAVQAELNKTYYGTGTPEDAVIAPIGSKYTNTTNGDEYRKVSGSGNTGWEKLAINSAINTLIGTLSNLTTVQKDNLVNAINEVNKKNIVVGLGTVSSNITLGEDTITTAYFSGTNSVTLSNVTVTDKQRICILDFTTAAGGQPTINQFKDLTCTFAVTNGNATVTGTGSALTTEIKANDKILIAGVEYTVSSVTSNTVLVLTANYAGTTASGLTLSRKYVRWSDKNQGKAPSSYSILVGVRNTLNFKSVFEGGLLYWEAEYSTFGGVETTFVRPNLAANGSLGGASFAISVSGYAAAYYGFNAVDGSTTTAWIGNVANSGTFIMYNPLPIKATSFDIRNFSGDTLESITGGSVYGSNDGTNWTFLNNFTNAVVTAGSVWNLPITAGVRDFYKYYKVSVTSTNNAGYSAGIADINPNATFITV